LNKLSQIESYLIETLFTLRHSRDAGILMRVSISIKIPNRVGNDDTSKYNFSPEQLNLFETADQFKSC